MIRRVFVVIVTYRRPELLEKCLQGVIDSTVRVHQVYIALNSQEPETMEVISCFQKQMGTKLILESFDNIGPAGGFHFGLKKFLKSDCEYVWLMDDDIIPFNNCLEELLKCIEHHPYIFPKVVNPSGKEIQNLAFGWWGVLLKKDLVAKVGLPLKEFFYWCEDTEFLQNRMIREHKVVPRRSDLAITEHFHQRSPNNKPSWVFYYTMRNTLYYRTRIFKLNKKGLLSVLKMYFGFHYRIFFKERFKFSSLCLLYLGIFHGIIGKLGKFYRLHSN